MRMEHSFTVPAPVDTAWRTLLDVPRVAPCMPGAALTEFDGEQFTGTVKVKFGPINITYRGSGRFVERDEPAHRVVLEASGREARGPGTAAATITATLVAVGNATHVDVVTDLTVTGRPAQFGRSMVSDVSARLLAQFADCLARELASLAAAATAARLDGGAPPDGAAGRRPAGRAATRGPGAPARPQDTAVAATEVEPIDVLEVTGAKLIARRAAPYLGAFVAGGLLAWWLQRHWRSS
jgi:uncharacterized protein